jgi:hypothetical protein
MKDFLLNLPGVTVVGRSQVEGCICFHLKILVREMDCPHCGKATKEQHLRPPDFSERLTQLWSTCIPKSPAAKFLLSCLPEVRHGESGFPQLATPIYKAL